MSKIIARISQLIPAQYRPTQKWVAGAITAGLTEAATALLPLGLTPELNGVIAIIAGLAAHYLVPSPAVAAPKK